MIKTLYDCFRHWSEKGSVYLFSDPHFADQDCKVMDPKWISPDEQIDILNKCVHKNDTLIVLGDVGDVSYVRKIKAYKVLISGNHDSGASNYKRVRQRVLTSNDLSFVKGLKKDGVIDFIENDGGAYVCWKDNRLFDEVYDGPLIIAPKIVLSHEPLPTMPFWLNIHGHDHAGTICKDGYHVNVAANVIGYTPISLGDIIKNGFLSGIQDIHRMTIDRASASPIHKKFLIHRDKKGEPV